MFHHKSSARTLQLLDTAKTPKLFVLKPQNQKYLTGETPLLYGTRAYFITGVLMLMFVIGGVIIWIPDEINAARLDQSGQPANAVINNLREWVGYSRYGNTYHYDIRYEYEIADQTYTRTQEITRAHYEELVNRGDGSTLNITYLPDAPTVSRLAGADFDNSDLLGNRAMPVIFIGLFGGLALSVFWRWYPRWQLGREGQIAIGRVEKARGKNGRNGYTVNAEYTFQTSEGERRKGKTSMLRNDLKKQAKSVIGRPVVVLYNERRSEIL